MVGKALCKKVWTQKIPIILIILIILIIDFSLNLTIQRRAKVKLRQNIGKQFVNYSGESACLILLPAEVHQRGFLPKNPQELLLA